MRTSSVDFSEVLAQLERETFLRHTEWHDELDSTNSLAMSLARRGPVDLPLLIGATRQTSGRGRSGNSWWSSDGALTFSLLLNPLGYGLPFDRWPLVALMTGLAVADTLEHFLPPSSVQLKWPNDVYAHGRKICGILTEVPAGRADRLIVGIGLNVANSLSDAPAEIRPIAVSLCELLEDNYPTIVDVLPLLIARWQFWWERLAADDIDFPNLWRTKCLLTGSRISVTIGDTVRMGICRGLAADGTLLLETTHGVESVLAGTVRKLDS